MRPTRSSQRSSSAACKVADSDRLQRALATADLIGELAGVDAVRVDAAVGAERDAHAGLQAFGEPLPLGERRLVVLAEHVGAPALLPAGLSDVVAAVDVRHQERPASAINWIDFVVHQRAMLDRAYAAAHGALDAFRAVRMRGDVRARQRRFLDRGADLLLGEFGGAGHASGRHHGAGSDQLHQVRAAMQHPSHRAAHVVDRVDHPDPELVRHDRIDVRGQPGNVASPAGAGHVRSRDAHTGTGQPALRRWHLAARRRRRRGTCPHRAPS